MRILLACSAGMSTSLLEKTIQDYMNENNLKGECIAMSTVNAINEIEKWDVVLLGPQVKFEIDRFKEASKGKIPISVIPPADYALAKGENVYLLAVELLKK